MTSLGVAVVVGGGRNPLVASDGLARQGARRPGRGTSPTPAPLRASR